MFRTVFSSFVWHIAAALRSWWWTENPSETHNKEIVKRCMLLVVFREKNTIEFSRANIRTWSLDLTMEDNYCDNRIDWDVTGSQSYPLAILNFTVFLLLVKGLMIIPQMIDEHTECPKTYVTNFSWLFPTPNKAKKFLSTWLQKWTGSEISTAV